MRKAVLTTVLMLMAWFFTSCATQAANTSKVSGSVLNESADKKISITGIPAEFNGIYGDISLAVYDETGIFNWIAWSEPVIINKGSVTNVLQVNLETKRINIPFNEDGEFVIYFKIDERYSQDLPYWQGYIFGKNITLETTIIPWSEFEEVWG